MKIYLVRRTDQISWDEYDSFVVVAMDEDEALSLCNQRSSKFQKKNTEITEVKPEGEPTILLGSFNAG